MIRLSFVLISLLIIVLPSFSQEITGGDSIGVDVIQVLEVKVLNYDNLEAVEKLRKFELGVSLPQDTEHRIDSFIRKTGSPFLHLNPFVEWDVDVEAVFTHSKSKQRIIVDGFYTREYLRVEGSKVLEDGRLIMDDWVDIDSLPGGKNLYPFRIRFAPPKTGEWTVEVQLKVRDEYYVSGEMFSFMVINTKAPGFVKVHKNQVNLERDGELIFPIGHNLLSPPGAIPWGGADDYLGKNHFTYKNTEKAANTQSWGYYFERLIDYFEQGGKYIRDMQAPWMSLIEFEEKGNYFKRLHYAQEIDSLLAICEKYDGLMNFNLMIHEPFMKYANYGITNWDWGHYGADGKLEKTDWVKWYPKNPYNDKPFGEKDPHHSFLDPSDLEYHKQRTRYYVARYGYSTSVYEFELLSEPFHVGEHAWNPHSDFRKPSPFHYPSSKEGQEVREAVYNYHKVLAEYLRDTLNINQLIGIDMGVSRSEEYGDYTYDSLSLTIPQVDVIGLNYYYLQPDALFITEGKDEIVEVNGNEYNIGGNSIASRIDRIWYTHDYHANKKIPVLFSEGGVNESYLECSDFTQFYVDLMTYPFSKVAGFYAWYGWNEGMENLRNATIRSEQFLNQGDFQKALRGNKGEWVHGKQFDPPNRRLSRNGKYPKETQYYVSTDGERAVGYIRNLSYNVKTNAHYQIVVDSTCLKREARSGNQAICYDTITRCMDLEFDYDAFNVADWFDYRKGKKFKIDGLENRADYCIDYYSFNHSEFGSAELIETECKRARGGNLTLNFPTLDPWNPKTGPVIWFVIRKE